MNDLYFATSLEKMSMDDNIEDNFVTYPDNYLDQNGILHLFVRGMLLNDVSPIEYKKGNTGYNNILDSMAEFDEQTKGIMLHVDSPGGKASGSLFELCEILNMVNVPVLAHIKNQGCSAAYKVACTSDFIAIQQGSICGSIGSILKAQSTKAIEDKLGIKTYVFTNKEAVLKDGDLENKKVADFTQAFVNKIGTKFINWVKEHRPDVKDEVFSAGFYLPEDAIDLGLVDAIMNEESAYYQLLYIVSNQQFETNE